MFAHPAKAPKAKTASQATPAHASKSPQQRAARCGNQAVLLLLAKKQGLSGGTPADGQLKTRIAPVEELSGRKAERVIDAVVASSPLPARTPAALRPEPECEKTHERTMRQKQAGPATVAPTEAPAVVHDVLSSPGEQLDAVTRAHFEPRFGFDFSGVRVHRDAQAAESARAVHARAYTVGDHVVFGDRQAIEHTQDGQATLAHELAHVIQQNRGGSERPALRGGALEHFFE